MGTLRVAVLGCLLNACAVLGYAAIPFCNDIAKASLAAASVAMFGAGIYLTLGAVSPALADVAPRARLGFIIGLGTSAQSLGMVLGPAAWGPLYQRISPVAPFIGASAWALLAALGLSFAMSVPSPAPTRAGGRTITDAGATDKAELL